MKYFSANLMITAIAFSAATSVFLPAYGDSVRFPLKGIIQSEVAVTIDTKDVVLARLHGLTIEVHNNTDRALIFDGDRATATVGGTNYSCASGTAIESAACPAPKDKLLSTTKAVVAAAASIGAIQTIRDMENQAGPIPLRYGCDEARRQDALSRFGKRIVWPGDSTRGIIYFPTRGPLQGASVEIPVIAAFDKNDTASIIRAH